MAKKKSKTMLSAFSIILILIFGLGILSHLLPNAVFVGEEIVNGSGVKNTLAKSTVNNIMIKTKNMWIDSSTQLSAKANPHLRNE